jgi:transglutaminase-like putative cysteine protease
MHIHYGYTIEIACDQPTPLITMLDVHPSQRQDITAPDTMTGVGLATGVAVSTGELYQDDFGNICRRIAIPRGGARISAEGVFHHSGFPEEMPLGRDSVAPDALPPETLPFLLGSRYCETEKLSQRSWDRFGKIENGYERVQAICDYVHSIVRFDYGQARATRTASEVLEDGAGVCRDFAHLSIALCRTLNIPARYCTGYLGDIGVEPEPTPMDFSAWFEAYLDGDWWTFDARHNTPRIGRILIARGRDATDVPIVHSFGPHTLTRFDVVTEEVEGSRFPVSAASRRDHHLQRGHVTQEQR